ncbi:Hypothetical predicted protein [Mytilus galloprovincialis]|uniref:Uncharacterized protein n=1 Tax=Mytilus galloprovincialis TaxID=29158 RepID=A0A8B6HJ05_MYTGA|nr:Hypothetical predicted protein [Mytilus galloprovincialis]
MTLLNSSRTVDLRCEWPGLGTILESQENVTSYSCNLLTQQHTSSQPDMEMLNDIASFVQEQDGVRDEVGTGENADIKFKKLTYATQILPAVLDNLSEIDRDNSFINFMKLIHENKF